MKNTNMSEKNYNEVVNTIMSDLNLSGSVTINEEKYLSLKDYFKHITIRIKEMGLDKKLNSYTLPQHKHLQLFESSFSMIEMFEINNLNKSIHYSKPFIEDLNLLVDRLYSLKLIS